MEGGRCCCCPKSGESGRIELLVSASQYEFQYSSGRQLVQSSGYNSGGSSHPDLVIKRSVGRSDPEPHRGYQYLTSIAKIVEKH
jgi:hypothetical protein